MIKLVCNNATAKASMFENKNVCLVRAECARYALPNAVANINTVTFFSSLLLFSKKDFT